MYDHLGYIGTALHPASCLECDPLPLPSGRDLSTDSFFVQALFFVELGCSFRFIPPANILQGGKIVPDGIFLPFEGIAQMLPKRYESSAHDPVGDDLVVMCFQQEEDNT